LIDPVKPRRPYRSKRRAEQAEATRVAILGAARALFTEKGWSATTIAAIADKAGVATETIYARFGNKRAIAHALIVAGMRGSRPDTPFLEQDEPARIHAETDPERMVDGFATYLSNTLRRMSPVLAIIRTAAETDAEMRDLYVDLHETRLRNFNGFAKRLAAIGGLRKELNEQTATDHLWSIASPELFLLWMQIPGADPDAHKAWMASALKRLLLPDE
jgi:AcrR family transcriptional regulator